jgi:putative DNA primase/helicase
MPPSQPRQQRNQPRNITPELVRDALACIPPDVERDTWARVAMAIKSELSEGVAFDLWNEWSARGDTYDERNARDTWRSIKGGGRTTIATLFGIAKEHGFTFPESTEVQTPEQVAAAAAKAQKDAAERQAKREAEAAELVRLHEDAAQQSLALWEGAALVPPAAGCAYLKRKVVQGYGLRYLGGVAVVPMRDAAGRLWSVQRLLPKRLRDPATGKDGTDKLYGPPKRTPDDRVASRKTGLFHVVGQVEGAPVLLLAEGYATAASLHEAAGLPVVVCFDSGNLVHVAKALRPMWPALPFLVCGDDDKATEARGRTNAGRVKAYAAAEAAGAAAGLAAVVLPAGLPENGSDFNDLVAHAGLQVVAEQVAEAVEGLRCAAAGTGDAAAPGGPATSPAVVPAEHETAGAAVAVDVAGDAAPADAQQAEPGRRAAPPKLRALPGGKGKASAPAAGAAPVAAGSGGAGGGGASAAGGDSGDGGKRESRDPFYLDSHGLWYIARDNEGNTKPPMWLSAPLHVTAITRDESDNGYGYLIEFNNRDGNHRVWAAPSALFGGDASEWAAKLRDMGLRMATGARARNLVGQYVDSRNPDERVTCTDRVGWHGGVYVLPSRCIGTVEGKRFVFQSESGVEDLFRRRGELTTWQSTVSARCVGNSRLAFVLGCAFAGPLLSLMGVQTGGFHITGDSSLGKTTALLVAASVWGSPKFKQQWRTTDNGLESVAVQSSDSLLILDEIGQMDGRVVGDCAYMLGNEAEKIRGSRGLMARRRRTWRLLFLSSGEKDLATHMLEAGKKPNEGQLVRMPSVPGDAGAGLGMLECLHDVAPAENAGKVFAETLTAAAAAAFGSAGAAWLEWLAGNLELVRDRAPADMRRMECEWVPASSHPQVWRVATRFALVGVAGELATEAGITGWQPGEAETAARKCFDAWLIQRGHAGNGEEAAMLRQVRLHLEGNGSLLYSWIHRANDDHNAATPMRCGFKRYVNDAGEPIRIDPSTEYVDAKSAPESIEKREASIEFLVLPESWKRVVCKGFEPQAVAEVLRKRGHLVHQKDRLTDKQRLPGMGKSPVPCFHVKPSIFADDF